MELPSKIIVAFLSHSLFNKYKDILIYHIYGIPNSENHTFNAKIPRKNTETIRVHKKIIRNCEGFLRNCYDTFHHFIPYSHFCLYPGPD